MIGVRRFRVIFLLLLIWSGIGVREGAGQGLTGTFRMSPGSPFPAFTAQDVAGGTGWIEGATVGFQISYGLLSTFASQATVHISATAPTFGGKPIDDLEWRFEGGGWTPLSPTEQIVHVYSWGIGVPGAASGAIEFRARVGALESPGIHTLPVRLRLAVRTCLLVLCL